VPHTKRVELYTPDERRVITARNAFKGMADNDPSTRRFATHRGRILDQLTAFWANCLWINSQMNPEGEARLQLLVPNRAQLILLDTIADIQRRGDPVRIVNLKARQKGLSTGISAWIMTQLVTHWHSRGAVMAHTKDAGEGLFGMYWRMYEGMKSRAALDINKAKGSEYKRMLTMAPMDSSIQVLVADEPGKDDIGDTGRSVTFQYLHCSEVPFWRNPSATLKALRQCVHRNEHTAIFLESTARAYGDVFHKQWINAFDKKESSLYVPLFIPWFVDDEYTIPFPDDGAKEAFGNTLRDKDSSDYGDELKLLEDFPEVTLEHLNWRRWKLADDLESDLDTFRREFPSYPDEAFQSSQGNWLSPLVMVRYKQEAKPPIFVGDFDNQEQQWARTPKLVKRDDGLVRIWKKPVPFHEFLIGTDSAEGNEFGDHSAAEVMCRNPEGIWAEVRGTDFRRPGQTEFAEQVYWTARYYNDAWVNPESNMGQVIASVLVDIINYMNVLRAKDVKVGPGSLSRNPEKVGWWKCAIVEQFIQPLAKEWFQGSRGDPGAKLKFCPNAELLNEAMECILLGNKVQAPNKGIPRRPGSSIAGYYDDRVIALFGCLLAHHALPEALTPDEAEEVADDEYLDELEAYMMGDQPQGYSPTREMPYGWLQNRPSWRRA